MQLVAHAEHNKTCASACVHHSYLMETATDQNQIEGFFYTLLYIYTNWLPY
jgi:hypothetical protein